MEKGESLFQEPKLIKGAYSIKRSELRSQYNPQIKQYYFMSTVKTNLWSLPSFYTDTHYSKSFYIINAIWFEFWTC